MKKVKWFFLCAVVIFAAVVCLNWDAVLLRFMPKIVLSRAVSHSISQLGERFALHPFRNIVKFVDPDGKYTAEVEMTVPNDILGSVRYAMNVQTDGRAHRFSAEGAAHTERKSLDFSAYMDQTFMAISSEDLVRGNYYGIAYDTFQQDIRKIPLLNYFVSQSLISQWDHSVQQIKEMMMVSYTLPVFPQLTDQDIGMLLTGLMALPCDRDKRMLSLPDGFAECTVLSYHAEGAYIQQIFAGIEAGKIQKIQADFYLHQKSFVKLTISAELEDQDIQISINLGQEPKTNPLQIKVDKWISGIVSGFEITIDTDESVSSYDEKWIISNSAKQDESAVLEFQWIKDSSSLSLTRDSVLHANMKLQEEADGLRIITDDIFAVYEIIHKKEFMEAASAHAACTMKIRKGSNILLPQYKNIDQWSADDFLILLEGIGSILGLRINGG